MERAYFCFTLALWITLSGSSELYAQFGKLEQVFKKANRTLSDLEINEQEELALGKAISEKICARYGVQQDLEATRYVTLAGLTVAQKSTRANLTYRFLILDSGAINAFAAPGGYIHITRGALAALNDEAELGCVMGHEIAHVTEKHTVKGLQKMKGFELAEGQTSLTSNSALFAKVVDKATQAILQGFGRAEELESDVVGVRFAVKAGYDPRGLTRFLATLKSQNEGSGSRAGLFSSHPETQERIDKLEAQIVRENLAADATAVLAERLHQWIKYQIEKQAADAAPVEGAKGLTSGQGTQAGGEKGKKDEKKEEEKKKGRFSLSKLKNPFGMGKKDESAEVTGAGAGRGVGEEEKKAEGVGKPKNPAPVVVEVARADLDKFRKEGKLR
jgi:predicted Zn-dependent protease